MKKTLLVAGATALLLAGGVGGAAMADSNLWRGSQNLAHTRAVLEFMSDKLSSSVSDLKQAQDQNTKVQAQLSTAQQNANNLQAQVNDLNNKLAEVQDNTEIKAQLADVQAKLAASNSSVADLQNKLSSSDNQVKTANAKITDLQGKYDATSKQLGDTNVVNKNLQQQLNSAVNDAQATSDFADKALTNATSEAPTQK